MLPDMLHCRHANHLGARSASGGGFYPLPSGTDWTPAVSFAVLAKVCSAALTASDAAYRRLQPRTVFERPAARGKEAPHPALALLLYPPAPCSST